jgi:hypothetical protein
MTAWTLITQTRSGNVVRQSYTAPAADASGIICREVVLVDDPKSSFENPTYSPPGVSHARIYCESMCFVPTASGTPNAASWVLSSSTVNGERTDDLWTRALSTTGALYLSITHFNELPSKFPARTPPNAGNTKMVACSLTAG